MIDKLRPYERYRSSGFVWLGDLPSHWDVKPNRSLFYEVRDRHCSDEQLLSVTISHGVIQQAALLRHSSKKDVSRKDKSAYKLVRPGDIVYNKMRAWQGAVGLSPFRGIVSPAYVVMRPRVASGSYFHNLFRTVAFAKEAERWSYGITSDMWSLRPEHFKMIYCPVPPPEEQTAIVRFLEHVNRRIDHFIRAKKKLIALLKEQKQALIDRAVTLGLNSRGNAIFPRTNEDYLPVTTAQGRIPWLRSIPSAWSVLPSGRVFEPRQELARAEDEQLSATQAYGVIPQAEFERRVGRRVVKISMHLEKRRHVERDDFVISMRSFQGGLERAWASGCIRSSYVVLQPRLQIDTGYFAHLLKSSGYIRALQATANFIRDGQDLNFENFRLVDLPVPPLAEQQAIAEYIDANTIGLTTSIGSAQREVQLLTEYRTSLVMRVVTGELDVRAALCSLPTENSALSPDPRASDATEDDSDDAGGEAA